jgi:excisionase family DNA binding protein
VSDPRPEVSLDKLAENPTLAAELAPADRGRVQLRLAAILAALAKIPATESDALYKPEEAATRLRVSRSTVYEMLRDGRLQYVKKGERGKVIPESAIREFAERETRRAGRPTLAAVHARVRAADDRNDS